MVMVMRVSFASLPKKNTILDMIYQVLALKMVVLLALVQKHSPSIPESMLAS